MGDKLTVIAKFVDSMVHYRKGAKMVKIEKMGDATQAQLEELQKLGHPGVIKEAAKAKPPKKAGS